MSPASANGTAQARPPSRTAEPSPVPVACRVLPRVSGARDRPRRPPTRVACTQADVAGAPAERDQVAILRPH